MSPIVRSRAHRRILDFNSSLFAFSFPVGRSVRRPCLCIVLLHPRCCCWANTCTPAPSPRVGSRSDASALRGAERSGDLRVVLDCRKNPSAPPGLPPLAVVAPHARLLRHRQRVLEPTLPPSLTAVLLRHVLNETTPSSPSSWCVLQAHLAILLHLLPAPDVRGRGLTMRAPLQHRRLRLSHVMFRPTFTAFLVSRLGELRLQFHKRQLQIRLPPSFLLLWLFRDWWLPASTMESPARGCICHHHQRRCQLAFSFCRSAQLSVSTAFASC